MLERVSGETVSGDMGLRERKRLAAMRRIQTAALDLFDKHGYQQVSIERIAETADVSPSSVYRYFGTKEQIVLWDEYDPVAVQQLGEEVTRQPLMAAVRQVVSQTLGEMVRVDEDRVRRRIHYMMQEPAITAAAAVMAHDIAGLIITRLATELGRDRDDLELYLMAHGFVGAIIGAIRYWHATDFQVPIADIVDRMVSSFEHGFRFEGPPA